MKTELKTENSTVEILSWNPVYTTYKTTGTSTTYTRFPADVNKFPEEKEVERFSHNEILSVKRLVDGQVFSVGDKVIPTQDISGNTHLTEFVIRGFNIFNFDSNTCDNIKSNCSPLFENRSLTVLPIEFFQKTETKDTQNNERTDL